MTGKYDRFYTTWQGFLCGTCANWIVVAEIDLKHRGEAALRESCDSVSCEITNTIYILQTQMLKMCYFGAVGRARAWHARGHGFESEREPTFLQGNDPFQIQVFNTGEKKDKPTKYSCCRNCKQIAGVISVTESVELNPLCASFMVGYLWRETCDWMTIETVIVGVRQLAPGPRLP